MEGGKVPVWDLADRMRKALRESGIKGTEMAAYLEVNNATVSRWINGETTPNTSHLRDWARRTGISYEWLKNGSVSN